MEKYKINQNKIGSKPDGVLLAFLVGYTLALLSEADVPGEPTWGSLL